MHAAPTMCEGPTGRPVASSMGVMQKPMRCRSPAAALLGCRCGCVRGRFAGCEANAEGGGGGSLRSDTTRPCGNKAMDCMGSMEASAGGENGSRGSWVDGLMEGSPSVDILPRGGMVLSFSAGSMSMIGGTDGAVLVLVVTTEHF